MKTERPIEGDGNQFQEVLGALWKSRRRENFGTLRCNTCRQRRWMDLHWYGETESSSTPKHFRLTFPGLALFNCRECGASHAAAIWMLKKGPVITLFGAVVSVATPSTPKAVAYYLDQAARSKQAGARSAATAMFRGALEQVLFEQGFTEGMLAAKLIVLETKIKDGSGPRWARDLEPEELKALKNLGNGAIHPNNGDIERQAALDDSVLETVEAVFEDLLEKVYEEPLRRAERLKRLATAAATISGKATAPPPAEAVAPPPAEPKR